MRGSGLRIVVPMFAVCIFSSLARLQPTFATTGVVQKQSGSWGDSSLNPQLVSNGQEPVDRQSAEPIGSSKQAKHSDKKHAKNKMERSAYNDWLDQEVPWIITPEEREAFKQLTNDDERDKFVETFWYRRDPTPDTIENEFREEYFRRVMYANERFGAGIPGWKTDRGRIYIVYGPPDEIDSHPSGGTYDFPAMQGGGSTQTFPFEQWRYRYIQDIGQDIVIEFVDPCMCGDYHMTIDPNEKDALAHVPSGQRRLQNYPKDNTKLFEDLDRNSKLNRPPKFDFKELHTLVSHTFNFQLLPFEVLTSYVKATSNVTLVPVTIEIKNRDMTFANENGVDRGMVHIQGQVTSIGGRIVQTFEDTVQLDVPHELLPKFADKASLYGKSLPLAPGRYMLEILIKDVHSEREGGIRRSMVVPSFEDELATSSIILADKMERVPKQDIGRGTFVIGDTLVRPRVPAAVGGKAVFRHGEKLNVWMQVYNLAVDAKDGKTNANVEFDVIQEGTKKTVMHGNQTLSDERATGGQLTLHKTLSADDLEPGVYRLRVRVKDEIAKHEMEPETVFAIE